MPALLALALLALPQEPESWLQERLPGLVGLYQDLHRNPELSFQESRTSSLLAERLRGLGFEVTEGVGGTGVVGLLENGAGPRLLLRTDMDALPVEEATGLPWASRARAQTADGRETGVMHACGHDLHMTVWAGTLEWLAAHREAWSGTLLAVAQPAEEIGAGARAMLEDRLYERFGRPDYCLALHTASDLPAGWIGWTSGFALANVDSVDIRIHGRGGHGSAPHTTRDPIVLAARIVLGLQTLVSRELDPQEPGVVTVGSIHGGTKHNIIPETVDLQLTVRSYSDEARRLLLDGIRRTARFEARAAGFPEALLPEVQVREEEYTPATWNDPELVERLNRVFAGVLGPERLVQRKPTMGGEDFGRYSKAAGSPGYMFWLGAIPEERWRAAQEPGAPPLPSLHTNTFAPLAGPAIRTGVLCMTAAVRELLPAAGG